MMEYWHLPGPMAFAAALADSIADGHNIVVACPSDIAQALTRMICDQRWDRPRSPREWTASGGRPIEEIFDAFDLGPPPESPSVATVVASAEPGRAVVVSGVGPAEASGWMELATDYESACRAVSKFDRAQLLIICGGVPVHALPTRAPALDIMVWNGWVGEADVLGYIVQGWRREGRVIDPLSRLCARIITRLASWDFDLVDQLMRLEPRLLFDPVPILKELAGQRGGALLRSWESGGIGSFDGVDVIHSLVLAAENDPEGELLMRLWAAQAAELLPLLEVRRRALVARMKAARQHAQAMTVNNKPVTDLNDVEISGLSHIARHYGFPAAVQSAAERLRYLRNHLAHLRPVTIDDARMVLDGGATTAS